jgi:ParB/RepB/Spo0J family partition protein
VEFRVVELALIDDPEVATRVDIDEIELDKLARDIAKNGCLVPPILKAKADRWEVVDGHRRTLAMRRNGTVKTTCGILGPDEVPPEEVKLKTNMLRVQNNDAELAVYIGDLVIKYGYTMPQLMDATGMSEHWINERYALLQGDPNVLQALNAGQIKMAHAKVINACPDASWRGIALHYAIDDQLPATKLDAWLKPKYLTPPTPTADLPSAVTVAIDAAPAPQGVKCDWCGGDRDPQNMVFVTLHRWEWEMVQKMLASAHATQ